MWALYRKTPFFTLAISIAITIALLIPLVSYFILRAGHFFCQDPLYLDIEGLDAGFCFSREAEYVFRHLAVLSAVASVGSLGSSIGFATRREPPSRLVPDLESARINPSDPTGASGTALEMFVVQFVGAALAVALSFVFFGGLVGGSLFPNTSPSRLLLSNDHDTEFYKLITWAFIAGFSQRTVPTFLARLVNRANRESASEDEKPQLSSNQGKSD